jgi:hypothetical protein
LCVLHYYFSEIVCGVTFFAIGPKISFVNIVTLVTADTRSRLQMRVAGLRVACRTNQPLMLTRERKLRCGVMIKSPHFPVARIMTFGAGRRDAQCSSMVFIRVARLARDAFGFEALIDVTLGTLKRRMLADQWEARQIMIEFNLVFPSNDIVATLTVSTKTAIMRIIVDMASNARDGGLNLRGWSLVTGGTFKRLVRAL